MLFTRRESIKIGAVGALSAAAALDSLTLAGCSSSTSTVNDAYELIDDDSIEVSCSMDIAGASDDDLQSWIKESVYDVEVQADIKAQLDARKDGQTLAAPIAAYNPFGTNTQSLYLYFLTDQAASVSYTVGVAADAFEDVAIDDFAHEVDGGASSTEHEFQVIGLIPGVVNAVVVTASYDDGTEESCVLAVDMCAVLGDEELQLDVTDGTSDTSLAEGLYAILGNDTTDASFMYYYDNQGILRGEVPVIGYRSHRMLFDDANTMYYSISHSCMAALNTFGQIVGVYDLGVYNLHHDYVWADETTMLILATDTSRDDSDEDLLVSLDIDTGEVVELVDMGELMPDFKQQCFAYHEANYEPEEGEEDDVPAWMHMNSLQYLADEDAALMSSRETSTIFKISGATSGSPAIEYLLASELFWADSAYGDLVFAQVGDFTVHGGQHCLTYVADDALEPGQYYLQFFNNNLGVSASVTNDFDYEGAGIGAEEYSYYYEYLVDENAGTFELVDSLQVPYSGYVSSVQWIDGNLIIDSGSLGYFTEYDSDYEEIRSFSMGVDKFIYRVFKYDL